MAGGYMLEDGEIKIGLDEEDFLTLIEEAKDCKDILKPHIRIEDNFIIFRDKDVKMIIPEEVFLNKIPEYELPTRVKALWVKIMAVGLAANVLISYILDKSLVEFFNGMMITIFILIAGFIGDYFKSKAEYVERHRKALYIKAKFYTYLLMVFTQDVTTTSNRLTRTGERYKNENEDLKSMIRVMYGLIPEGTRSLHISDTFPDGEPIVTKSKNKYS